MRVPLFSFARCVSRVPSPGRHRNSFWIAALTYFRMLCQRASCRLVLAAHAVVLYRVAAWVQAENATRWELQARQLDGPPRCETGSLAIDEPGGVPTSVYSAPFFMSIALATKSVLNLVFERDFVKIMCAPCLSTRIQVPARACAVRAGIATPGDEGAAAGPEMELGDGVGGGGGRRRGRQRHLIRNRRQSGIFPFTLFFFEHEQAHTRQPPWETWVEDRRGGHFSAGPLPPGPIDTVEICTDPP